MLNYQRVKTGEPREGNHGSQLQGMLSVSHMCCCKWLQAAKRQARYSQLLSENSIKFGVPCLFQPKNRVLFLDTPSGSLTRHGPLVMRSITMRHGPLGTSIGGSWSGKHRGSWYPTSRASASERV